MENEVARQNRRTPLLDAFYGHDLLIVSEAVGLGNSAQRHTRERPGAIYLRGPIDQCRLNVSC